MYVYIYIHHILCTCRQTSNNRPQNLKNVEMLGYDNVMKPIAKINQIKSVSHALFWPE